MAKIDAGPLAQVLDEVPGDLDHYHLMIKGQSLTAVGKVLFEKGLEVPENCVFCGDTPQWTQSSQTINLGNDKIKPSQFTGINVRAGGSAMVTADGTPSLSDAWERNGGDAEGRWDDPSVPTGTAIYGAQTPGSIWAERATLSDQGYEAPGLPVDHLVVYRHTTEFKIPNKVVGKPKEDVFDSNDIYPWMPNVVHNWSSNEGLESVEFGGGADTPIINEEGQLICQVNLLPDTNGYQPKLTVEPGGKAGGDGMKRIDPSTVWACGPPGGSAQTCAEETYEHEKTICEDRAKKAYEAEQARYNACYDAGGGSDCDKFSPSAAQNDCFTSCCDGTSISESWRSDCYDDNYSDMGGRLPDQWHLALEDGGCGCGNKANEYKGCNFEFIVNIV